MCNYKAKLKKCDIEPLVIEVIKEIVGNEFFVTEIQKRIGKQTDSSVIDRELKNYQQKLKEVEANKFRLEQEIDNMPLDAKYRERKIQDMTTRLESLYETMMDLEGLIKDAQLRKNAIEEDVMTMENIYRLLLSFSQIYDKMDDIEKKNLLSYLIKRIDIYANDEGTTQVLKSIEFNFPIYKDGTFVRKILLDERVNVETCAVHQRTAETLRKYCPEFHGHGGGPKDEEGIARYFGGAFDYREFRNDVFYDRDGFIGRNLSASYAPREGEKSYGALTDALSEIFDAFSSDGRLLLPHITAVYWGRL